jgi:hypothetical protein
VAGPIRRRSKPPKPTTQEAVTDRFNTWRQEDLFGALETSLMEVTGQMDVYRRSDAEQKALVLPLMTVRLQTALQVVHALQQQVANDKRNQ